MMRNWKTSLIAALLALVMVFSLAACGGEGGDGTTGAPTSGSANTTGEPGATTAPSGNVTDAPSDVTTVPGDSDKPGIPGIEIPEDLSPEEEILYSLLNAVASVKLPDVDLSALGSAVNGGSVKVEIVGNEQGEAADVGNVASAKIYMDLAKLQAALSLKAIDAQDGVLTDLLLALDSEKFSVSGLLPEGVLADTWTNLAAMFFAAPDMGDAEMDVTDMLESMLPEQAAAILDKVGALCQEENVTELMAVLASVIDTYLVPTRTEANGVVTISYSLTAENAKAMTLAMATGMVKNEAFQDFLEELAYVSLMEANYTFDHYEEEDIAYVVGDLTIYSSGEFYNNVTGEYGYLDIWSEEVGALLEAGQIEAAMEYAEIYGKNYTEEEARDAAAAMATEEGVAVLFDEDFVFPAVTLTAELKDLTLSKLVMTLTVDEEEDAAAYTVSLRFANGGMEVVTEQGDDYYTYGKTLSYTVTTEGDETTYSYKEELFFQMEGESLSYPTELSLTLNKATNAYTVKYYGPAAEDSEFMGDEGPAYTTILISGTATFSADSIVLTLDGITTNGTAMYIPADITVTVLAKDTMPEVSTGKGFADLTESDMMTLQSFIEMLMGSNGPDDAENGKLPAPEGMEFPQ